MIGKQEINLLSRVFLFCGCLCLPALFPGAAGAGCSRECLPPLWAVPEALVYSDAGLYDHPGLSFALIVDKRRQKVILFRYDGYWRTMARWPCSTGKLAGPKTIEGDQRTPEGIYFTTRDVGPRFLTDTYGARALPLDYPNWLDRRLSHSGSAIWLHGTNKPLQPRDTNGCVVLENETIKRLAPYLRLNRTPVIIVDRLRLWPAKNARHAATAILSAADQWHTALVKGNYDEFAQWYEPQAAPSKQWWKKWCRERHRAAPDGKCRSLMSQRAIYRSADYYVLIFDHVLSDASRSRWVGRRKLYWTLDGNRARICGGSYQTVPGSRREPLLRAWRQFNMVGKKSGQMAVNDRRGQTAYSVE
jgi:murein L,D-transpeptidase YafK